MNLDAMMMEAVARLEEKRRDLEQQKAERRQEELDSFKKEMGDLFGFDFLTALGVRYERSEHSGSYLYFAWKGRNYSFWYGSESTLTRLDKRDADDGRPLPNAYIYTHWCDG